MDNDGNCRLWPTYYGDEQQQRDGYGHPIYLPERVVSRDDVYISTDGRSMMNNNNNNNKKAKKRRVRHDLPGPAGSYFRRQRPQKMPTKKEVVDDDGNSSRRQSQSLAIVTSSPTILKHDPNSPPPESSGRQSQSQQQQQQQQRQAFHDHASDLHECNAWNMMCVGLDRIVPRPDHTTATILASSYKNILRTNVSNEYALIHEIHEGKYDIVTDCGGGGGGGSNNNIDIEKTTSQELRLPLLVGYVATIHCHDHSDWTALLVDEMHGAAASNTNRSSIGSSGKGVVCWIEEKLVKRHPNWVRPGCVWCIEGAKLALFASDTTCNDTGEIHDVVGGSIETCSTRHATNTVLDIPSNILGNTHDISPSTESARGGGQIDRMILIGEYCMVYAWTPEESSASFGHDEFINLMERRLGLGLPDKKMCSIELIDDGDDDGACILGRTNIADRSALFEELGDAESRNHNTDSSLNEFAHTSKQLKSGLSTASPVTASDRSFAAATIKSVQPMEQCNDHVESIRSSSPSIINVLGQPHGENASIPSPRVALTSLPFPHVEEGNADCNNGNDESKFCGKSIVTEGLLVMQSTGCAEALCKEQQDKMIENVGQSARDNVELLRITPPRGASLPSPTTTTSAKKNSGSCPPVNANATAPRSVSCETASSVSCDNIINDNNQNLQQCKAPSEQKYVNTFDDDDALDDELLMFDTTAFAAVQTQSCSTPKAASNKQQMYSQQLRMNTGDSFDYMLDEDDDNSCPGVPAAGVLQGLIKPTSDCPDNKIKSSSNPTIPVVTRGSSLFDSLDGDDLDFLNEDE